MTARRWLGLGDGSTEVDANDATDCVGIDFSVEGVIRRRPGLTHCVNLGGNALGSFRSPLNGAWLLIVTSGGNIESQAL